MYMCFSCGCAADKSAVCANVSHSHSQYIHTTTWYKHVHIGSNSFESNHLLSDCCILGES